jgi:hypothetical protein
MFLMAMNVMLWPLHILQTIFEWFTNFSFIQYKFHENLPWFWPVSKVKLVKNSHFQYCLSFNEKWLLFKFLNTYKHLRDKACTDFADWQPCVKISSLQKFMWNACAMIKMAIKGTRVAKKYACNTIVCLLLFWSKGSLYQLKFKRKQD